MGAAAAARAMGTQGWEEQCPELGSEAGTHPRAAAGRAPLAPLTEGLATMSSTLCREAEDLPASDGTSEAPAGSQQSHRASCL